MYSNGIGQGPAPYQAATNGMGMLPPQAASNGIGQGITQDTTPMTVPDAGPPQQLSPALPHGNRAWRDGVFGRAQPEPYGQALRPWRDGVFGPALPGGLVGLGQNGNNANVLDLHDPGAVKELKTAMGMLGVGAPLPESFYQSDVWEWDAADLTLAVAQSLASLPDAQVTSSKDYVSGEGDKVYLNGPGIYALAALYRSSAAQGPGFWPENFPRLEAFTARPNGTVSAPYFSVGEKAESEEKGLLAGMSTYAYWGLGVVALVGLYMVLKK